MSTSLQARARQRLYRAGVATTELLARPTAGLRSVPDYLIVGGQRCGTTSLHHHLVQHPGVLGARLTKGVHWFDVAYDKPESWYLGHFPFDRLRQRTSDRLGYRAVTGEGSPYYLFHPFVPARIRDRVPEAKVIVLLRDPVERAWSAYHHERKRGFEPLDFEAALAAEPSRLAGQDPQLAAPNGHSYHHLHHGYVARGRYLEQLERVWASFPAEQVLVLFTADLEADLAAPLGRVHTFLGLPTLPPADDRRWNKQAKAHLAPHLRERLQEAFAEPDRRLAERLGRPLPWTAAS